VNRSVSDVARIALSNLRLQPVKSSLKGMDDSRQRSNESIASSSLAYEESEESRSSPDAEALSTYSKDSTRGDKLNGKAGLVRNVSFSQEITVIQYPKR